jgi:hypothetical protein
VTRLQGSDDGGLFRFFAQQLETPLQPLDLTFGLLAMLVSRLLRVVAG